MSKFDMRQTEDLKDPRSPHLSFFILCEYEN